jgi:nucleoside-diphosphate-sugar epimerase
MKILITGGNGHVGGAIKARFESSGHDVVIVSRHGDLKMDISDDGLAQKLSRFVERCDVIVHCAAHLSKSVTDREVTMVNCVGTQEVVSAALSLGTKRLIYISGLAVIGTPKQLPIDENHPLNPNTAYHSSKLFGEHIMEVASSSNLQTVSLRVSSPVGPQTPRGRIFSEFVYKASRGEPLVLAGSGGRRQNYVDVRDVADAVAQCARSDVQGVFNVAGAASVSNLELAECCVRVLSSNSTISFSGTPDAEENVCWNVSIDRARSAFGYSPSCSIEDSINAAAKTL